MSNEHLQVYIDEFTFRYNRRGTPMAAFQTLLGLGAMQPTDHISSNRRPRPKSEPHNLSKPFTHFRQNCSA